MASTSIRSDLKEIRKAHKRLERLDDGRKRNQVNRRAFNAGLQVLVKAIKNEAPVGESRKLKRSIGKKFAVKRSTGEIIAKAGINVGKKGDRTVRYGAAVAGGSSQRTRDDGGETGQVSGDDFVARATAKARAASLRMIAATYRKWFQQLKIGR